MKCALQADKKLWGPEQNYRHVLMNADPAIQKKEDMKALRSRLAELEAVTPPEVPRLVPGLDLEAMVAKHHSRRPSHRT